MIKFEVNSSNQTQKSTWRPNTQLFGQHRWIGSIKLCSLDKTTTDIVLSFCASNVNKQY